MLIDSSHISTEIWCCSKTIHTSQDSYRGCNNNLSWKALCFLGAGPQPEIWGIAIGKDPHLCPSYVAIMLQEVLHPVDTSNLKLRRSPDWSSMQTGTPLVVMSEEGLMSGHFTLHIGLCEMLSVVASPPPYKSWSCTHEGWNEDLLLVWSFM
jgi:hypothetical protein